MSDLWLPPQQPTQPERHFAPLEIKDADRREMAVEALRLLWHAMDLYRSHIIPEANAPSPSEREVYRKLHSMLGQTLLGKGAPEFETLC